MAILLFCHLWILRQKRVKDFFVLPFRWKASMPWEPSPVSWYQPRIRPPNPAEGLGTIWLKHQQLTRNVFILFFLLTIPKKRSLLQNWQSFFCLTVILTSTPYFPSTFFGNPRWQLIYFTRVPTKNKLIKSRYVENGNGHPAFNKESLQWVYKTLLLGGLPSPTIGNQWEFRPEHIHIDT